MAQTAKSQTSTEHTDFPGFFDLELNYDSRQTEQSDPHDTVRVDVKQAAALLGITERTVWRRIKQRKLLTHMVDGRTLVIVTRAGRDTDSQTAKPLSTDSATDPPHPSVSDSKADVETALLLAMIEGLQNKLEGASYRNGYLESQLSERDQQIKLLTDSQHSKRSLLTRFVDWLKGQ